MQLSKAQLSIVLGWAKSQQAKSGDLLARARSVLFDWERVQREYAPSVSIVPRWFGAVIAHSCSCPSWKPEAPCKHVMASLLLLHRDVLSSSSAKWAEFFRSLDAARSRSASSSPSSSSPASGSSSSRPSGSSGSSRRRPRSGGSGPSVPPEFGNF